MSLVQMQLDLMRRKIARLEEEIAKQNAESEKLLRMAQRYEDNLVSATPLLMGALKLENRRLTKKVVGLREILQTVFTQCCDPYNMPPGLADEISAALGPQS